VHAPDQGKQDMQRRAWQQEAKWKSAKSRAMRRAASNMHNHTNSRQNTAGVAIRRPFQFFSRLLVAGQFAAGIRLQSVYCRTSVARQYNVDFWLPDSLSLTFVAGQPSLPTLSDPAWLSSILCNLS